MCPCRWLDELGWSQSRSLTSAGVGVQGVSLCRYALVNSCCLVVKKASRFLDAFFCNRIAGFPIIIQCLMMTRQRKFDPWFVLVKVATIECDVYTSLYCNLMQFACITQPSCHGTGNCRGLYIHHHCSQSCFEVSDLLITEYGCGGLSSQQRLLRLRSLWTTLNQNDNQLVIANNSSWWIAMMNWSSTRWSRSSPGGWFSYGVGLRGSRWAWLLMICTRAIQLRTAGPVPRPEVTGEEGLAIGGQ